MFSYLNFTQLEFSDLIVKKLGRGAQHASMLYSEWYRSGKIEGKDPAFNNAGKLLQEILQLTDLTLPKVRAIKNNHTTQKFLVQTEEGYEFESVIIPMRFGNTLCVSSQVGCRMGCTFCETGRMGLFRSLSVKEICSQLFHAKFTFGIDVARIVFMGMGEPFDNFDNVKKAIDIFTDPAGFGLGRSHITVSTSGVVEGIYRMINEMDPAVNLAVSVNAPSDLIRNQIMPVNRKHSMQVLHDAMKAYCQHRRRQILAEYVMIEGLNDSVESADLLADYLRELKVKVNLIPYNAQSNFKYQPPTLEGLNAFAARMRQHGYQTLVRNPKGRDIMAACGQLGNVALRRSLREAKSEIILS